MGCRVRSISKFKGSLAYRASSRSYLKKPKRKGKEKENPYKACGERDATTKGKTVLAFSHFFFKGYNLKNADIEKKSRIDPKRKAFIIPSNILVTGGWTGSTELGSNPEKSVLPNMDILM